MIRYIILFISAVLFFSSAVSTNSYAFSNTGCEGDCRKCHSLTNQDVNVVLKKMNLPNAKILTIQLSPVKSLWEVSIDDNGKRGVFYLDFSKKYLVPGPIIEVATGANKTQEHVEQIQIKKKVDVSNIPLKNALVVGSRHAAKKVIVFTDPD